MANKELQHNWCARDCDKREEASLDHLFKELMTRQCGSHPEWSERLVRVEAKVDEVSVDLKDIKKVLFNGTSGEPGIVRIVQKQYDKEENRAKYWWWVLAVIGSAILGPWLKLWIVGR